MQIHMKSVKKTIHLSKIDNPQFDLDRAPFDPADEHYDAHWAKDSKETIIINIYKNGLTFSIHKSQVVDRQHLMLRDREYQTKRTPQGKHLLIKEHALDKLDNILGHLFEESRLPHATVYMGTTSDPFSSFASKFEITTGVLSLLEKWQPSFLVLQTRLAISLAALPQLKAMENKAIVSIPLETFREDILKTLIPHSIPIRERLLAADGFRAQEIGVHLSLSPLLPYGKFCKDAWKFADLANQHADYISVSPLVKGSKQSEREVKRFPLAMRLTKLKHERFLRPDAAKAILQALRLTCPEKTKLNTKSKNQETQLSLFVA